MYSSHEIKLDSGIEEFVFLRWLFHFILANMSYFGILYKLASLCFLAEFLDYHITVITRSRPQQQLTNHHCSTCSIQSQGGQRPFCLILSFIHYVSSVIAYLVLQGEPSTKQRKLQHQCLHFTLPHDVLDIRLRQP